MPMIGHADHHRVNVGPRQKFVVVVKTLDLHRGFFRAIEMLHFSLGDAEAPGIQVADRDDARQAVVHHVGHVHGALPPATNLGDLDALACGGLAPRRGGEDVRACHDGAGAHERSL